MKRLFTLMILAGWWGTSMAQVLSLNPSSFNLQVDVSSYADAHAVMWNNSNVDRTITWVRVVHQQPNGWYSMVCDDNNCYSPSTSTMNVALAAGAQGILKLSIFPNDVAGYGEYTVYAYDANDSANVNASMYIQVNALQVGVPPVRNEVIAIFPNPVRDMLYINLLNKSVTSIELYSIIGQKLRTLQVQPGHPTIAVPVAELKKGMYFLRVYSNQRELVTRMFSKE
ncbi:MAG: T9SS type A sorting domain-containing protein [Chitinophagales bacterium]|nr:T9SS type A sorting domain-containing protein [Chitinophagales bacterium]MDW8393522.1 T9SS type A sorting domain-containing protein [Chitinophagales bacterium]